MTYATLTLHGYSELATAAEKYRLLSDAFTIPGSILLMVGLLVAISNAGNFIGLGYAVQHLKDMLVPFSRKKHGGGVKLVELLPRGRAIGRGEDMFPPNKELF